MNLYLLRHGIAVERGTPGYRDRDRPLTRKGIRGLKDGAAGLCRMRLEFDLILSSPYERARRTAEIVAKRLRLKRRLKFSPALAADATPKKVIAELAAKWARRENVLLVGHEPYLSRLAARLISGRDAGALQLKKGGMLMLETEHLKYGRCASLVWLLTPKQLARMG